MRLTVLFSEQNIIKDAPAHRLPLAGLTDAKNVRLGDASVQRSGWDRSLVSNLTFNPSWLLPVRAPADYLWIVAGDTEVYGLQGRNVFKITRAGSSYLSGGSWSGGNLNGVGVIANGLDVPQAWVNPGTGIKLINLLNWPAGEVPYVIRPFLNVLVALGMRIGGNEFPYRVKTSHPADPGTVPVSWDETDPTRDVVSTDLAETPDVLIDGGSLRSFFVIYKQNTTWLMLPFRTGGSGLSSLFRFEKAFSEAGLLSQNCFADIGNRHFAVTDQDIVIHDGVNPQSLADQRIRKWFFNNLSPDHVKKTFVVKTARSRFEREVWICFVPAGETVPKLALAWNQDDNTWTTREIDGLNFAVRGPHLEESSSWDALTGAWDEAFGPWEEQTVGTVFPLLMGAGQNSLLELDAQAVGGASRTSYVERLDFPFGVFSEQGQVLPSYEQFKLYRYLFPFIEAPKGTRFSIRVGGRDTLAPDETIKWRDPKTFVVGRDKKIDLFERRKLLAYRISCDDNVPWKMTGMDLDYELKGRF